MHMLLECPRLNTGGTLAKCNSSTSLHTIFVSSWFHFSFWSPAFLIRVFIATDVCRVGRVDNTVVKRWVAFLFCPSSIGTKCVAGVCPCTNATTDCNRFECRYQVQVPGTTYQHLQQKPPHRLSYEISSDPLYSALKALWWSRFRITAIAMPAPIQPSPPVFLFLLLLDSS